MVGKHYSGDYLDLVNVLEALTRSGPLGILRLAVF